MRWEFRFYSGAISAATGDGRWMVVRFIAPAKPMNWDLALRPKQCRLALHSKLRELVASKLILDWSPEQISGWLKSEYPGDESMRVPRNHLPQPVHSQARGVLKKELMEHLRPKRRM